MSKRLQLDYVNVKTVEFGPQTKLDGDKLVVSKEDLLSRIDTSVFASAEIILARPGENVRIIGPIEFVQPRVKADAPDTTFPGFWGKLAPAGDGRTVALRGVLVTQLYPIKANSKSLLDMSGPLADRSMISRHNHIILDFRPAEGMTPAAYADAQQKCGLALAVCLAKLAIDRKPDDSRVYELGPVGPGPDGKPLPKVAYLTTQRGSFVTATYYYYGQSGIGNLPMIIHPNDFLDGAFLYCYGMPLYYLQEEAMIKELYARHGKDIDFVGMVVTSNKTETVAKNASSMMAAMLAKEVLGAEITLNTKYGYGHGQLEQQMFHVWSEDFGMKAVTVMPGVSSEKPGDLLVISEQRVDAVVHSGSTETMEFPHVETLIGFPDIPALSNHDLHGPFVITTNGNLMGSFTTQGGNYVTEDLDLPTEGWGRPAGE